MSDVEQSLTEALTIGGQAALAAFEAMLGPPALQRGAPHVASLDPATWMAGSPTGWVVSVPLQQGARGAWALALEEQAARAVVERLLTRPFTAWDDLAQSALMELGNVGACAFWGGVAPHARPALVPGVPAAHPGGLAAGLQRVAQPLQRPRAAWAACGASSSARDWQATEWLILEQAATQALRVGSPQR